MLRPADYDACYRVLDLESGATETQIDDGWKLLVSAWHPDKFVDGLKEKATRHLQEVNNARDELIQYWRRHGRPPPTAGEIMSRTSLTPAPERAAPEARPAAQSKPTQWRRIVFAAIKWLLVCGVVWLFWRPIHWQGEVTIIQLLFWLLLIGGSAQLIEAIAKMWFGPSPARRRGSRA
jgi:hypothetical protein